jgi:DNA replication and repair protein RecF
LENIFEKEKNSYPNSFLFLTHHHAITGSQETVQLVYESHLFENNLLTLLQENIKKTESLHYTSVGTHKDDLSFEIDGHPIKKIRSQGQQKSFLIALKLAQFEFLKNKRRRTHFTV